jgi:aryl-alcohol dehydrogenase-like predicted oxidoreductase
LARGIESDVLPVTEKYGMGVLPWSPLAGGWLAGTFGTGKQNASRRAERIPARYDMKRPENQRKLAAVDQLTELASDAGLTLIQLAIGFVLAHPAVTCPIIGPRTAEHLESQLAAADVRLEGDVLDRIDEIVPPGTDFSPADAGWVPPSIASSRRRRRTR